MSELQGLQILAPWLCLSCTESSKEKKPGENALNQVMSMALIHIRHSGVHLPLNKPGNRKKI